jgi:hypothetical protein
MQFIIRKIACEEFRIKVSFHSFSHSIHFHSSVAFAVEKNDLHTLQGVTMLVEFRDRVPSVFTLHLHELSITLLLAQKSAVVIK